MALQLGSQSLQRKRERERGATERLWGYWSQWAAQFWLFCLEDSQHVAAGTERFRVSRTVVDTLPVFQNLGGLLKHRSLVTSPKGSDSVGLERGLRICISNKFLSEAHAMGLEMAL